MSAVAAKVDGFCLCTESMRNQHRHKYIKMDFILNLELFSLGLNSSIHTIRMHVAIPSKCMAEIGSRNSSLS